MKRILFLMVILLTSVMASAQQKGASIAVIDSATYNFGDIKEDGGPVTHTFTVINNGETPLVITNVVPSCGCTTRDWTKEPIAPGKTGDIQITYDPNGRPNTFTKTINVYSNGQEGSFILTIRGNVIPKS